MTHGQIVDPLQLRPGDVIRRGRGNPRVVREVHVHQHHLGWHVYVTLVIRHCSWTRRCYTVIDRHQLTDKSKPFTYVGHWRNFGRSAMERRVARAIREKRRPGSYTLTCHDVAGVP